MSRYYKETKLTSSGKAYEKEIDERYTELDLGVLTKEVKKSLKEQEEYAPKEPETYGDPGLFRKLFSLPSDILTPIMAVVWTLFAIAGIVWLIWLFFF